MSTVIIITPPPTKPPGSQEKQSPEVYAQLLRDAETLRDAGFTVTLVDPHK